MSIHTMLEFAVGDDLRKQYAEVLRARIRLHDEALKLLEQNREALKLICPRKS
jgi:hypothetical protein